MVQFRPHKLRIVTKGEGYYDDNGDWQEGTKPTPPTPTPTDGDSTQEVEVTRGEPAKEETPKEDTPTYIPCRYEPNGAAQTITLPDGTAYRYSYTIYLDVNPALTIKYGDLIELTSQDGIVIAESIEVRGFHRGQLDMKIWV